MAKLWGGRFRKSTDKKVDDFNSSIRFDKRMYEQDIRGSIAHATMLGKQGIIPQEDADKIVDELKRILADIKEGKVEFLIDAEDIHMNIEKILTDRIGDAGKRLHTGRSRNDQVALDIRMYLMDETAEIEEILAETMSTFVELAKKHTDTIMPGYTHLQKAQPITFAHHCMAYFEMFKRDYLRLKDCRRRTNVMPLGSGALAGTTYPLDRQMVADMLGFDGITMNSLDGVSDRDFCIELLSALSILMMHLSRFCEEIILWSSHEFKFIELDDAYSTGSSIMPQKKNPDVCELIRGKTGRVYGNLISLLTIMKALPLAYNKDMQEDKEGIFDSVKTAKDSLIILNAMLKEIQINKENMLNACKKGHLLATDLADYLVREKNIPFRKAHFIVGNVVAQAEVQGIDISEIKDLSKIDPVFDEKAMELLNFEFSLNSKQSEGSSSIASVEKQIQILEGFIQNL